MATMAVLQKLVQRRSELRIVKTYMNFCRDSLKEMVR